ncbi:MAG: D-3-phosphoglycerate dehydrogenase [Marinoscillum sp.]|jgi:D-3-phosphoglycerate dehydrogenase
MQVLNFKLHFSEHMEKATHIVIDFDSTFTRVEALDVLCEVSLKGKPDALESLQKIKAITDLGMEGKLSFRESLEQRLEILKANKSHLPELIDRLSLQVSESFKRNKEFVQHYADQIIILSNGFRDFIIPIVEPYGIKAEHVYANEFVYDLNGNIVGFDRDNVLSSNNGKPKKIEALKLKGAVVVIGDGYTDFEIKKAGIAHKFYAFTENVKRANVLENADHEAPNLDEFLYMNNMNRALSYPKSRINVLLLENIHEHGVIKLKEEGYNVKVHPAAMDEDELIEAIKDVSILGIRSKTQVTARVLEHAHRLLAVGAFCIGINQIDLNTCLKKGIVVFNAPFSNTRSVVEMAIAEIIMLMRNLPDKSVDMHKGVWTKSASGSFEVRGKTLGIIGYGNIGAQLSVVAESLGIKVQFYDLEEKLALGNAHQCKSLEDLLATSDMISVHVDGRPENNKFITEDHFSKMKDGVVFLNLSRGPIVDIPALRKYVLSGKIQGVGVDVFPEEPLSNKDEFMSELRGLPNTILTPHIGGSTLEAQQNIADFVPGKIIEYINTGSTNNSVNFPNIVLPRLVNAHRFIHIHRNEPGVLARINNELATHNLNIVGQYLKTNEEVGYVITDINKDYHDEIIASLKSIKETIRFRVLY